VLKKLVWQRVRLARVSEPFGPDALRPYIYLALCAHGKGLMWTFILMKHTCSNIDLLYYFYHHVHHHYCTFLEVNAVVCVSACVPEDEPGFRCRYCSL
jgi:hypothetical protein